MSTLPTTPVGKQQLIDMKAGAILRGHAKKSERYLGCPVRLLLTFIVLIKSSMLCAWLVREYFYFDFRCTLLSPTIEDMPRRRSVDMIRIPVYSSNGSLMNYYDEYHERVKRYQPQGHGFDPRLKSPKQRKKSSAQDVQTTMVTMMNTQVLPADGDTLRMKTIRNRVKPLSDDSDEDDMVEIDIDSPPIVYITRIQQRGEESNEDLKKSIKKPRKRKGKGKKKKKKLEQSISTTTEESRTTKKRKGHRRKQNKEYNRTGMSEQTKLPRHLFSSPGVPEFTTPRPHQSSFLHGVIDPKDPQFSNKGQIRGYPMHVASRKPTPSSRLSEETRLMWQMDELNYTTHATALKTTAITDLEKNKKKAKKEEETPAIPTVHLPLPIAVETQTTTAAPTRRTFYSTHQLSSWKLTVPPPTTTTTRMTPITRTPWIPSGVLTEEEKRFDAGRAIMASEREMSTLEQLNNELLPTPAVLLQLPTTPRPRPIKHGFDRSLDEVIDSRAMNYALEKTIHQNEIIPSNGDFQSQLSTFSSSATCIARTMFDLWCACQLLTLFPYLIGVCVARRSLFVAHLVLDILLLVIGFVYTITMIVFSMVLYVLVGEMPKEVLFEWVLFALLIDAILLLYACLVIISLRCCERIVQSRLTIKLQTPSTITNAEQV